MPNSLKARLLDEANDQYADHNKELGDLLREAAAALSRTPAAKEGELTVTDYEEVLASHRSLVRELDVAINGEAGAAKQASLCDIVAQVKKLAIESLSRQGGGEPYCWAVGSYIFTNKDHADQAMRQSWKEKDWHKGPMPLYTKPTRASEAGDCP